MEKAMPTPLKGSTFRYTVFGVRHDLFVEHSTNDLELAALFQDWLSCSEYKARIFDNVQGKFLTQQGGYFWH